MKIRETLRALGLSQKQLAERIQMPPSAVSQFLTGKRAPPVQADGPGTRRRTPVNFQARVEQALAVPPGTFTMVSGVTQ